MLFNSFEFIIFLVLVFSLYWLVFSKEIKSRNAFLLVCSYTFYGWWDWRFLGLIILSSGVDFALGKRMDTVQKPSKRKRLLWMSLIVNLGILGVFKYYNFFVHSFAKAFQSIEFPVDQLTLEVILPVGISFYTFQTLSYTIDIYRGKMEPEKDWLAFFAFVAFFPQLVAGPIERASHLLPQFRRIYLFNHDLARDGLRQMLWGFFKKIAVADTCALYVPIIFGAHQEQSGATLLIGCFLFAIQIYGDFSGYSDIAIGCSKLFGFDLRQNFDYPYFSRNIGEFWRRWHISLSTWFRDYLYIPLGGSKGGKYMTLRNLFVVFLISGLWHGARWTYVVWGLCHVLMYVPGFLRRTNRTFLGQISPGRIYPDLNSFVRIVITFTLTSIAWVFFRSYDMPQALGYLSKMFLQFYVVDDYTFECLFSPALFLSILMFAIEWWNRDELYGIEKIGLIRSRWLRWMIYFVIIVCISFCYRTSVQFLYFQF